MRILLAILLPFLLLSNNLSTQNLITINEEEENASEIILQQAEDNSLNIRFQINAFTEKSVETTYGPEKIIDIDGGSRLLLAKAPDLPKLSKSFLIGDFAEMDYKIISANYIEYDNYEIAPSKGNLSRTIDPSQVPYIKGKIYEKNAFFPEEIVKMNTPYILRDYRAQNVHFYPIQYNPVSKVLRVYYDVNVEFYKTSENGENPLVKKTENNKYSTAFDEIYKKQFINYAQYRYTPLNDNPGRYLIICNDAYLPGIQDFAAWKTTIGFPTEVVAISSIGNNQTSIKNYVTNYYNTKGLSYLLLVGDAQHITPMSGSSLGGHSDVAYGYIVGNDKYADIFVGRFSAESQANVETQVSRTIAYELNPSTNPGIFNKSLGISSDQGPGDDNEYDYEHIRNMQTDLAAYNYISNSELFDGSQGGLDATGNPTPTMVTNELNQGRGLVLYTGHGSATSWVSSGFSSTNILSLNNQEMLPFIWSVACVNGDFVNNTCFAEQWLRSIDNNGDAIGAIATFMSTINQSWDPPMEAQDEMVDVLVESYSSNIKRSFGGLSFAGSFKMNDTYGDYDMTDTWTIFGDPSLMVRTDNPQTMTVSHPNAIPIGVGSIQVNCNVNDAFVCLSTDTIIGTAIVSGGVATVNFAPFTTIDTFTVAVTAYNYIPYIGEVIIIPASGPYVSYTAHAVKDPTGNLNNQADYGENIILDMELTNVGSNQADSVYAEISCSNPHINLTDSMETYGDIASSAAITAYDAYRFDVSDSIADQDAISFTLSISDKNSNNWINTFNLTANAPNLKCANNLLVDDAAGNANARLDPGETVNILIDTWNAGHADHLATTATLSSTNPYITINNGNHSFSSLDSGGVLSIAGFNISLNASCPIPSIVDFVYTLGNGAYQITETYYLNIGIVSEDFETGDFSNFAWSFSGNRNWEIDNQTYYAGSYSAVSGDILNNQQSDMFISLDVISPDSISFMKKVSCELGDSYSGNYYWYDYLDFLIDGSSVGRWDGIIDWSKEQFYVSTVGLHTFKWTYYKDGYASDGSDCAWVDDIVFPPSHSITTNLFEEEKGNFMVSAYPNPFSHSFVLRYAISEKSDILIRVYNQTGQMVKTIEYKEKQAGLYHENIITDKLSAGIYICEVISNKAIKTMKLIKQH
jgi:hypothetical protein